ncbi:hypothetical protein FOWG_02150 [Fusarium oxysporum f. sp. lycopersici MN25]|nr:hypothetical protein FOWG_02150 [Fusarium oxysporum f. sp. lycopersici MN25]EWZ97786.1 hypothetical protein FOWG_02150 [Fusarium oxysporum f. sp. lycopersici MN25]
MLRTSFWKDETYGYSAEVLYARGFGLNTTTKPFGVETEDKSCTDGRIYRFGMTGEVTPKADAATAHGWLAPHHETVILMTLIK